MSRARPLVHRYAGDRSNSLDSAGPLHRRRSSASCSPSRFVGNQTVQRMTGTGSNNIMRSYRRHNKSRTDSDTLESHASALHTSTSSSGTWRAPGNLAFQSYYKKSESARTSEPSSEGVERVSQYLSNSQRQDGLGRPRIHENDQSDRVLRALGTPGAAIGQDVLLSSGLDSSRHTSVLKHELRHAMQVNGRETDPASGLRIGRKGDEWERDAAASGSVRRGADPQVLRMYDDNSYSVGPASRDWQYEANHMTLDELSREIQSMREFLGNQMQSSAETHRISEGLSVFESNLRERQGGLIRFRQTVAAVREGHENVAEQYSDDPLARLGNLYVTQQSAETLFAYGFVTGYGTSIPPGELRDLAEEMGTHPLEFYGGYLVGLPIGLWNGLTGLLEGLWELAKLGQQFSLPNLAMELSEEAYRLISDPEHLERRQRQYQQIREIASALEEFREEFREDPTLIVQMSADLGLALGRETGDWVTEDFLEQPPYAKGRLVGNIAGQILFEVFLEIILAAASAGIGNAIRGVTATGQAARQGGRVARILRSMIEQSPTIRRLIRTLSASEDVVGVARHGGRGGRSTAEHGGETVEGMSRIQFAGPESASGNLSGLGGQEGPVPARPRGSEVFEELGEEMDLDFGSGRTGGQTVDERTRNAVLDAQEAGFVDEFGQPLSVDAAFQPHRRATDVRNALGVSGSQYESAHIGATSFLRGVTGYSRSGADTILLPRQVHRAMDSHWKDWARLQRRNGRQRVRVGEMYDQMVEALERTGGLDPGTRSTVAYQLQRELRQLNLSMDDMIDLPYPNITPTSQ